MKNKLNFKKNIFLFYFLFSNLTINGNVTNSKRFIEFSDQDTIEYNENGNNYLSNQEKEFKYQNKFSSENIVLDLIEIPNNVNELAIKSKSIKAANHFANKIGFKNLGPIPNLPNTYVLTRIKNLITIRNSKPNRKRIYLNHDHKITFVENQKPLIRFKRNFLPNNILDEDLNLSNQNYFSDYEPLKKIETKKGLLNTNFKAFSFPFNFFNHKNHPNIYTKPLNKPIIFEQENSIDEIESIQKQLNKISNNLNKIKPPKKFFTNSVINLDQLNDELYRQQWYLVDLPNRSSPFQKSLHIKEAWKMGYTGKGIVITVIDDGLEWNHTDLRSNYDPEASIDLNDHDNDPTPAYQGDNAHGTRCAGEIAMQANNGKCGVGIAFNSHIGGIRLLDGVVLDVKEAQAFLHNYQYIDIYSSSWGPNDDGETVDGPKKFAREALIQGTNYGRKGKGNIYVWASGNGGRKGDHCNCDGYVGSIYTISIGSISQGGKFPWYGERCSAIHAVTYSSNSGKELKIATTDLKDKCTIEHTGTSAAAPIAAGIIALVLESNPKLTWRDVQHLIVWTSEFFSIKNNPGWKKNDVDLLYNDRFGFGMLNAEEMVKKAKNWVSVPKQKTCTINPKMQETVLVDGHVTKINFLTNGCKKFYSEVNYIEHVQINMNIEYPVRGHLEISLVSPAGTESILLTRRKNDEFSGGFNNWNFTSVHFWGEKPFGTWTLFLRANNNEFLEGQVLFSQMYIHGTKEIPFHMINQPKRIYKEGNLINEILDNNSEFSNELNQLYAENLKDIHSQILKLSEIGFDNH